MYVVEASVHGTVRKANRKRLFYTKKHISVRIFVRGAATYLVLRDKLRSQRKNMPLTHPNG